MKSLSRKTCVVAAIIIALTLSALYWSEPTSNFVAIDRQEAKSSIEQIERLHSKPSETPKPSRVQLSELRTVDASGTDIRRLSGIVYDSAQKLSKGEVRAYKPRLNYRKQVVLAQIDKDGKFSLDLFEKDFPGVTAHIAVTDGIVTVFSGKVTIGENIVIHSNSSQLDEGMTGNIVLPDVDEDAEWFAVLIHSDLHLQESLAVSQLHTGRGGVIPLRWRNPQSAITDYPLTLAVRPMSSGQSYFGHRRFDAVKDFRSALKTGIIIHNPERTFTPKPIRAAEINSLYFYPSGTPGIRYLAKIVGNSALFRCSLPADNYCVVGKTDEGIRGLGVVDVNVSTQYDIKWLELLPGPYDVAVQLLGSSGEGVSGALITRYCVRSDGLTDKLTSKPTDLEGRTTMVGCIDGPYKLAVWLNKKLHSTHDITVPYDGDFGIQLQELCQVSLEIRNSTELGLDFVQFSGTTAWIRTEGQDWKLLESSESRAGGGSGWLFRDIPQGGTSEFALRGPWWAGVARANVVDNLVLSLPVLPLDKSTFVVRSRDGTAIADAKVALTENRSQPAAPWGSGVTNAEGIVVIERMLGNRQLSIVTVEVEQRVLTYNFLDLRVVEEGLEIILDGTR